MDVIWLAKAHSIITKSYNAIEVSFSCDCEAFISQSWSILGTRPMLLKSLAPVIVVTIRTLHNFFFFPGNIQVHFILRN